MSTKLFTDSTSYIPAELRQELDISVISLSVQFPDASFNEDEVDYDFFYGKIRKDNVIPMSSMPSLGYFVEAFGKVAANGDDIVGVFISSDMSSTYSTALAAREQTLGKYPDRKIEIHDSRTNCMSLGLPVVEAARAAKEGQPFERIVEIVREYIQRVNFFFIPANLEYLKKGGRIGGASALLGAILKITPILYVDKGKTEVLKKTRGYENAIEYMISRLEKDYAQYGISHLVVHHIQCYEKGLELAARLSKKFSLEIPVISIGPVIGLHVGPGAVGFVYSTVKPLRSLE